MVKKIKPKECEYYKDNEKVLLESIDVIVFYRVINETWRFYEGFKKVERGA